MELLKRPYQSRGRYTMPKVVLNSLDQVYRSNPYPSRLEFTNLSGDMSMEVQRIKTWFNNRRRRDLRAGKICRHCRFFKAPMDESVHRLNEATCRPCIKFWGLPTVAPPPPTNEVDSKTINEEASTPDSNASSSSSEDIEEQQQMIKVDLNEPTDAAVPLGLGAPFGAINFQQRKNHAYAHYWNLPIIAPPINNASSFLSEETEEQQIVKLEMNEANMYSSINAAVPMASSLAFQPSGLYNFQQPIYPDQTAWFNQSATGGHYPLDMSTTGNCSWITAPQAPFRPIAPSTYWPLPVNLAQALDVQQGQFDQHTVDWRSTHVHVNSQRRQYVNCAIPYEAPYGKLEPPADGYNYYEVGPSSDN